MVFFGDMCVPHIFFDKVRCGLVWNYHIFTTIDFE